MNSNITSNSGTTPFDCQTYTFLGEKPDQTNTAAYAVHVLITVLSGIACPLTTVLNLLVIISVKKKPRLKTISNTVLGCLAVTDALMGMIGLPLFMTSRMLTNQAEISSDICTVKVVSRNVFRILGGATLFHLILMNMERYIAIKHPFQHITIVTKSRVLGSSALAWIAAFFTTLLPDIINYNIYVTVTNIILVFFMAVVIYCQIVIYCETHRQEKLIAAHQVSVEAKKKFLKEKKAFKITTTVLVILLTSYFSVIAVRILVKMSVLSENVAYVLTSFSVFVFFLNSLTNPVIYCLRTRRFRVAFIEILLGKNNAQAEELERRVFGSANNNGNHNNDNNNNDSNADNNNISNNEIADSENNSHNDKKGNSDGNNRDNNSKDSNDGNNNNVNNNNVNNNNNKNDDSKDNSDNNNTNNKGNNDGNNSDNNNVNNNNKNDDSKDNSDNNNNKNDDSKDNSDNNNTNNNDGNNSDNNNVNNNNKNDDSKDNSDNNNTNNKGNNDGNNSDNNVNNNNNKNDDSKDNSDNNINNKGNNDGNNSVNSNVNNNNNIDDNKDNNSNDNQNENNNCK